MIALLLSLVLWSNPAPVLWVCNPGKAPGGTPSNCERVHYHVLGKFPMP
jgi:hypothetical protein